uniref:Uncharacterized protein n=1 Tax=Rhizophora mucronata TaxID=61149 RepID=A0A2P2PH98_RHIMU
MSRQMMGSNVLKIKIKKCNLLSLKSSSSN